MSVALRVRDPLRQLLTRPVDRPPTKALCRSLLDDFLRPQGAAFLQEAHQPVRTLVDLRWLPIGLWWLGRVLNPCSLWMQGLELHPQGLWIPGQVGLDDLQPAGAVPIRLWPGPDDGKPHHAPRHGDDVRRAPKVIHCQDVHHRQKPSLPQVMDQEQPTLKLEGQPVEKPEQIPYILDVVLPLAADARQRVHDDQRWFQLTRHLHQVVPICLIPKVNKQPVHGTHQVQS